MLLAFWECIIYNENKMSEHPVNFSDIDTKLSQISYKLCLLKATVFENRFKIEIHLILQRFRSYIYGGTYEKNTCC